MGEVLYHFVAGGLFSLVERFVRNPPLFGGDSFLFKDVRQRFHLRVSFANSILEYKYFVVDVNVDE